MFMDNKKKKKKKYVNSLNFNAFQLAIQCARPNVPV